MSSGRCSRGDRFYFSVLFSEKELSDDIQTVAKDAFCLPAMFLDFDFLDVTVDVLTDFVAPHESDHHQE